MKENQRRCEVYDNNTVRGMIRVLGFWGFDSDDVLSDDVYQKLMTYATACLHELWTSCNNSKRTRK